MRGRVKISTQAVDFTKAVQAADFVILNAGHGSTCTALLSGKPVLQLPHFMEQSITTTNVERLHAGQGMPTRSPFEYNMAIESFLKRLPECQLGATKFAQRYSKHDGHQVVDEFVAMIDSIACSNRSSVSVSTDSIPRGGILLLVCTAPRTLTELLEPKNLDVSANLRIQVDESEHLDWSCDGEDPSSQERLVLRLASESSQSDWLVLHQPGYLNRAANLLKALPNAHLICLPQSVDEMLIQWLHLIDQAQEPINHWSLEREGFAVHALDACYPKYPTKNLFELLTLYNHQVGQKVAELAKLFPDRVRCFHSQSELCQFLNV